MQLDYDPRIITYEELLDIFWDSHDPAIRSYSRQYMSAVFFQDAEQRNSALASKLKIEHKTAGTVETVVLPLRSFTMAEDYHQKYMLKSNRRLKKEMTAIYPHPQNFVNSTAVTRLNGYAGGYGSRKQMLEDLDNLGLSSEGKNDLKEPLPR